MSEVFSKYVQIFNNSNSKFFLGFVSFIESIFFPIPPDILLIPMIITERFKWINLALLTTVFSVLGGVVGYYLGIALIDYVLPYIVNFGYLSEFNDSKVIFLEYGVLILFLASFTPIPYKIFTITAGMMSINFILFVLISFVGRGMRFFLIGYLTDRYKKDITIYLNKYLIPITLIVIIIFILFKL
ncbi:MAG: hypothetical protein CMD88_02975 [Gammaproteobacteria bacterium]|nr:hypothetical protein [Gammaproteobacteria bacterium]|tara:strand:- start:178 stop:735 length:558 start_codon:yes stop_codon:yes gene_type:complete